ncbi:FAD-dependent monooxygenase [Saccharopolyspora shandongensis]|uniref:FAD-dependent monooxygenase n=1 Tax=Saccharopolyspora shandongensis TaxID=418495 RepID=UPI003402AF29
MTGRPRVAVIGAGPAGLATTIALRRVGLEAIAYERVEALRRHGNGLTLWPNGFAALDAFGAGDAVRGRAHPAAGMAMRAADGRTLYEVSEQEMKSIGGNGMAVHRAELLAALRGLLEPDAVRFGARCVRVSDVGEHAVGEFADGSSVRADLVVGADGLRSAVRESAGLGRRLRHCGVVVWRATIPFELPETPGLLSMGGADAFGIWKLAGDRVYWFASAPSADARQGGPDWLLRRFGDWHEPIPELLRATDPTEVVATEIFDCRPLRAWSRGRIALVGDAAHPSMPNMGQGTSQAFEDAAVLAARLASAPSVPEALRAYERQRRGRANAATSQARMLARIGGWPGPVAGRLREWMLGHAPQRAQLRQLRRMFEFRI